MHTDNTTGSYALVTGASKGIGKAIAIELARRKYNLLLVARAEESLTPVKEVIEQAHGVQVRCFACDLSVHGAARRVYAYCVDEGLAVSILVNNAGFGLCGLFETLPEAAGAEMMQLNITTPVQLCQAFLPMLKQQPQAYILNNAGLIAYQALPYMALYAATKVFILHFSRALTHELKHTAVSITCISPGATDTDFVVRANIGAKALALAKKVNMTPEAVARLAIKGLFAKKTEVIPGAVNKISAGLARLLPKRFVETMAARIYS